jgi:hypothetical protein
MKLLRPIVAAAFTSLAFAVPTAYADDTANANNFVKACDADKDGMVSKAEVMKMVEKAFDKTDSKKAGRLDRKQVESLLKALTDGSMGG